MKRIHQKKLSRAEGRKRRKAQNEECLKSSKFLTAFLKGKNFESSTSKSEEYVLTHTSHNPFEIFEQEDRQEAANSSEINLNEMEGQYLSNSKDSDEDSHDYNQLEEPKYPESIADVIHYCDFGYFEFDKETKRASVSDALRLEIVEKGSLYFQNNAGPFTSKNNRSMTTAWFRKQLGKGKGSMVNRSWLVHSPLKSAAFCFSCLLFPSKDAISTCSSLETESGFNSWKKPEKITVHENSQRHRNSFATWKEMERKLKKGGLIDDQLQNRIATEKEKWRQVLRRVLCCIKYLAKQNLALRGHRESIMESEVNGGNFIEVLKLIGEFDPVIKGHLSYVQQNPGSTTYLSPQIQNEFIELLATTVRENLLNAIKRAKYYGIMFDSTPDAAHREQMSETVRYVDIDFVKKTVEVKESFLGFIQIHKKDAPSISDTILKTLEKDKLPFEDCRSQCYDNASVMSGNKSGVHQRLSELNSKALFINCDNHTLNLVGVHAVRHEVAAVTFFSSIQAIYVYFSRSTLRWDKLKTHVGVTVKSESETRWSARVEAVRPIHDHLESLVDLFEIIIEDLEENAETRSGASQLLHRILTFEFLLLLKFWNFVLPKIDRVQKRLQDPTMNFHNAAQDIQALQKFFVENREQICTNSLEEAKELCAKFDVKIEKRCRKKKKMPGELAEDAGVTIENEMCRVMKSMMDKIHIEMEERFKNLEKLDSNFGFLINTKELMSTEKDNNLKQSCILMGNFYDTDLDGLEMFSEIVDCRMLLRTREDIVLSTPQDLLLFIVQYGEDVFPNLRVGLQILLTIGTSIATCER